MCPQPPVSIPLDIDANSTDEEIVLFFGRRAAEDPIPSNVITEVNPFSIDPRNSPEGIWFLYTSKGSQSQNEGGIIKVSNGYWGSSMDDLRISTSTPTVGRKTTREFYAGQAPFGDRTGWRMHEYWAEQAVGQGNNKSKDNSALCRFFLQNDERSNNGEDPLPCNADGEYMEALLLSLVEQQQRNTSSRDAADGSEVVCEDQLRQLESSSRPNQDLVNDNSMEGMEAGGYDFSKEDFLELKDLYDPESSSSTSDNSSLMSVNSDECFDAEALLRDIENEADLNMEERVDYRFSVTSSVRTNQVVIRQPPLDFSINCNLVVSDNGPANSVPSVNPGLSSPAVEPQSDSDASASGSSRGSHGRASHSGSSQGGSTSSQRSRSKSVRRMAQFGKKYCCFGSGSFSLISHF